MGSEFADEVASMQASAFHHIVADGNGQGDFASGTAAKHPKEGGLLCLQLEREVFDVLGVEVEDGRGHMNA